jgi:hypothetical protein
MNYIARALAGLGEVCMLLKVSGSYQSRLQDMTVTLETLTSRALGERPRYPLVQVIRYSL